MAHLYTQSDYTFTLFTVKLRPLTQRLGTAMRGSSHPKLKPHSLCSCTFNPYAPPETYGAVNLLLERFVYEPRITFLLCVNKRPYCDGRRALRAVNQSVFKGRRTPNDRSGPVFTLLWTERRRFRYCGDETCNSLA